MKLSRKCFWTKYYYLRIPLFILSTLYYIYTNICRLDATNSLLYCCSIVNKRKSLKQRKVLQISSAMRQWQNCIKEMFSWVLRYSWYKYKYNIYNTKKKTNKGEIAEKLKRIEECIEIQKYSKGIFSLFKIRGLNYVKFWLICGIEEII